MLRPGQQVVSQRVGRDEWRVAFGSIAAQHVWQFEAYKTEKKPEGPTSSGRSGINASWLPAGSTCRPRCSSEPWPGSLTSPAVRRSGGNGPDQPRRNPIDRRSSQQIRPCAFRPSSADRGLHLFLFLGRGKHGRQPQRVDAELTRSTLAS
jgi:hypothetical protein